MSGSVALADFLKEFSLRTDACNNGVVGVLLQEDDCIKHPDFARKIILLLKKGAMLGMDNLKISEFSVWQVIFVVD